MLSVADREDTDRDPVLPAFPTLWVRDRIVPTGRPLDDHERRAFTDVVRIWKGVPLSPAGPPPKHPRPVTRRPRACTGCGQGGVRLRYGNRCERCWRTLQLGV